MPHYHPMNQCISPPRRFKVFYICRSNDLLIISQELRDGHLMLRQQVFSSCWAAEEVGFNWIPKQKFTFGLSTEYDHIREIPLGPYALRLYGSLAKEPACREDGEHGFYNRGS